MEAVVSLSLQPSGCITTQAVPIERQPLAAGKHCRHGRIALIDELPLRRASTLNLLRTYMRDAAVAFPNVPEFFAQAGAMAREIGCIIMNVGGRSLGDASVAEQVQQLNDVGRAAPVAVLSDREDLAEVVAAFRCGARGFIPSSMEPDVAVEALRLIRVGVAFFPAMALHWPRQDRSSSFSTSHEEKAAPGVDRWPRRQLAVLRLLGEGKANKEIARGLGMEESTVKVHVWHIMRRLDTANRTQAALRARELGILGSDDALAQPGETDGRMPLAPNGSTAHAVSEVKASLSVNSC